MRSDHPMALTEDAQTLMEAAEKQARSRGDDRVGTEHLLLAMALLEMDFWKLDDVVYWSCYWLMITPRKVMGVIGKEGCVNDDLPTAGGLPLADDVLRVLNRAAKEANCAGYYDEIASEHLLLGMLKEDDCAAAGLLRDMGVCAKHARATIRYLMNMTGRSPANLYRRHARALR